jgi:hypothetical protein
MPTQQPQLSDLLVGFDHPGALDGPGEVQRILRRDRKRITAGTIVTAFIWLAGAALLLRLLYGLYWDVFPKMDVLAVGAMHPGEPLTDQQRALMARSMVDALRYVVIILSVAVGIVTAAAFSTVALVMAARHTTLRQISISLRAVVEQIPKNPPASTE